MLLTLLENNKTTLKQLLHNCHGKHNFKDMIVLAVARLQAKA